MHIQGQWPRTHQTTGVQNHGFSGLSKEKWGGHTLTPPMLRSVVGKWKDLRRLHWPHHGVAKTHAKWGSFCGRGRSEDCAAPEITYPDILLTATRDLNYPSPLLPSSRPSPSHQPSANWLIKREITHLQGLGKRTKVAGSFRSKEKDKSRAEPCECAAPAQATAWPWWVLSALLKGPPHHRQQGGACRKDELFQESIIWLDSTC